MGKKQKWSLRSKAVHFVSDLTTVFLNPISDKPSSTTIKPHQQPNTEGVNHSKTTQLHSLTANNDDDLDNLPNGPDTSSFAAFLYSFLSSSDSIDNTIPNDDQDELDDQSTKVKKSLFARGKHSLGKTIYQAAKFGGYKNHDQKDDDDDDDGSIMVIHDTNQYQHDGLEMRHMQNFKEPDLLLDVPGMSEPSVLLTDKTRSALYASIPALVKGRKWLMLYSTWRHGISLSTLYRRSMLWPGLSLLEVFFQVVGDRRGAVFGGLVEAPLRPTNKKYQGTNNTFVFTNVSGHPVVYHPTGANRYFTLCSNDCLAIGGGGHFALYLDSDLLSGSSSVSETYANPCLANSEDFEVKEVELWGFVYASKFEEILTLSRAENPGICRW
ncbi:hypothetical protein ACFE04_018971 [Oxalis oulophora]